MSTTLLLVVLVAVAVIGIAVWYLTGYQRSRRLRSRFGPEYEHAVESAGSRRDAETELESRAKRVEELDIRPLTQEDRARFTVAWRRVQSHFVDDPGSAVVDADRLIGEVMEARGYPVADFEQRAADVSVNHPQVVDHYRTAHTIATRGEQQPPTTEELRQAMVHYRALFSDLLESPEPSAEPQPAPRRAAAPARVRTSEGPSREPETMTARMPADAAAVSPAPDPTAGEAVSQGAGHDRRID